MGYWDAYRRLPPWRLWAYAALCAAGVALILIDLFWKGARYTTIAFLAVIVALVLLRPGGWRGPPSQG